MGRASSATIVPAVVRKDTNDNRNVIRVISDVGLHERFVKTTRSSLCHCSGNCQYVMGLL